MAQKNILKWAPTLCFVLLFTSQITPVAGVPTVSGASLTRYAPRSTENAPIDPTTLFNPFGDLFPVNPDTFFSSNNTMVEFFKFSEENIASSKVKEWYAEWSVQYTNSSSETKSYEWEDFMHRVGLHPNFVCTLGYGGCVNSPSSYELNRIFERYPHHARRVYFVAQMYNAYHARAQTIDQAYMKAQLFLIDHIPEIVHNMQMEVDPSRAALCKIVHEVVEIGTSLVLQGASAITKYYANVDISEANKIASKFDDVTKITAEAAARIQELKGHAELIKKITSKVVEGVEKVIDIAQSPEGQKIILPWEAALVLQGKLKEMMPKIVEQCNKSYTTKADIAACTESVRNFDKVNDFFNLSSFGGLYKAVLGYADASKGNPGPVSSYQPGNAWDNLDLSGGLDSDPMCSRFEGGLQGDADHNIQELKHALSEKLTQMREILTKTFEDYYNGVAAVPGGMSETARKFMETKWVGVSSIMSDLHTGTKWQNHFELQLTMQMSSLMGAHDNSHMVCTRTGDAPALCAKAAQSEPCKKTTGCLRSIICPEPSDPELICKAQKWYPSVSAGGHITRFPSAEKWEYMMGNKYELTQRKALESVWQFYKTYGNNFGSLEATWGSQNNFVIERAGGFHLPVCYKEGLDITENNLPVSCGNWRSDLTSEFMEASYLGPNGRVYNQKDKYGVNFYITNALAKAADNKASSPLGRYLDLCELGVRWPTTADKEHPVELFKMHPGTDEECGMIADQTASMNETEANEWFCSKGHGAAHSVFEREHRHIAVTPVDFRYSHKAMCKAWIKKAAKNGKATPAIDAGGDEPIDQDEAASLKVDADKKG